MRPCRKFSIEPVFFVDIVILQSTTFALTNGKVSTLFNSNMDLTELTKCNSFVSKKSPCFVVEQISTVVDCPEYITAIL